MAEKITKRQKIFHPFLVAFFPILIIYSVNTGRIELEEFILPTILIVGGALLFFFALKHILKNVKKTALVVALSLVILFSYGHVYNILNPVSIEDIDLGSNLILGPIFVLLFGIGTFLIIKTRKIF